MLKEYLSTLANAFREVLGTTKKINAQNFKSEIYSVFTKGLKTGEIAGFEQGKAEGVTEGKPLGKIELLQDSEYMHAQVSGTAISVNDVSPIEHSVGCRVASKNMCDGSIILDGYEILGNNIRPNPDWYTVGVDVLSNTTYTASGFFSMTLLEEDANGVKTRTNPTSNDKLTFTTLPTTVRVYFNSTKTVSGSNQVELGTTATAYTPYVADVGGIEVSRLGKNLAIAQDVYKDFSEFATVEFEGRTAVRFLDDKNARWAGISFKPNTQYTVSFEARITEREEIDTRPTALLYIYYSDGTESILLGRRNTEWERFTLTSTAGKTVVALGVSSFGYFNLPYIDCDSFQLEEGSIATAYEPYNRTTYQSTADGTVEGVKSISPNMTLLSNNNGVVINANYLRDIDTYIDNLITDVALSGGEA